MNLPTIDSLPLYPVFKGAKTNQKRQPFTRRFAAGLPRQTSLCCSQKADASESREVYAPLRGTPPSRFLLFCSAARLRKMAFKTNR
jgi:hypothetical protein